MEGILVLAVLVVLWWVVGKLTGASRKGAEGRQRAPTQPLQTDWRTEQKKREEEERNKKNEEREQKNKETEVRIERSRHLASEFLERHADIVDQFLLIAERKVSTLDDYGDENWRSLDAEIFRCVGKIAAAEGGYVSRDKRTGFRPWGILTEGPVPDFWLSSTLLGPVVTVKSPQEYHPQALYTCLFQALEGKFKSYHVSQSNRERTVDEIARMTGVEFENYVMRLLKQNGWKVGGTPKTGDKGADIIARISDQVIVIQTKRSASTVGIRAVQEVAAAKSFYSGTEAWVVTNSSFTEAARELAQKTGVQLVCGADLSQIGELVR